MLKLNVISRGNGYQADGFGNSYLIPSQFDLDIVFHPSNGVANVGVGCYGNGWAVSKHVLWRPLWLAVGYNPEAPASPGTYNFLINGLVPWRVDDHGDVALLLDERHQRAPLLAAGLLRDPDPDRGGDA